MYRTSVRLVNVAFVNLLLPPRFYIHTFPGSLWTPTIGREEFILSFHLQICDSFRSFLLSVLTRVLCEPCRKKYPAEQLLSRMWFLFSIVITVRKDCRHGGSDEHITADFGLFVFLLFIAATLFICRFSCLSHFKNDPYRFSYTLLLHISVQPFTGMLYFEREMWAAQKQVLIREGSVC